MVMTRGEIWWSDLPDPTGSGPGHRRPVLIVQADTFNRSRISTVTVVSLTSNLALGHVPGNVLLTRRQSKLPKDSVVNITRVITLDRGLLTERVGRLSPGLLSAVDDGLRLSLGL